MVKFIIKNHDERYFSFVPGTKGRFRSNKSLIYNPFRLLGKKILAHKSNHDIIFTFSLKKARKIVKDSFVHYPSQHKYGALLKRAKIEVLNENNIPRY